MLNLMNLGIDQNDMLNLINLGIDQNDMLNLINLGIDQKIQNQIEATLIRMNRL